MYGLHHNGSCLMDRNGSFVLICGNLVVPGGTGIGIQRFIVGTQKPGLCRENETEDMKKEHQSRHT